MSRSSRRTLSLLVLLSLGLVLLISLRIFGPQPQLVEPEPEPIPPEVLESMPLPVIPPRSAVDPLPQLTEPAPETLEAQPDPGALEPGTWGPSRLIAAEHVVRWTPQEVQARAAGAFSPYGLPIVENAVDLWLLTVATTGLDGNLVPITAQLFVPVDPPRGASPLFVYGSGTTGIGASCAPSREALLPQPLGMYRELLAPYAGRGFVTVFPDYLGFDDPLRPQSYFHALSEAHVLLDSARAVREFFVTQGRTAEMLDAAFFGGYSQGGHAAFAVADNHLSYAPEVPLRGVMGFAGTTDVQALMGEAAFYAPYIVLSYRSVYGPDQVDPAQIFASRWLPNLESTAGSVCVDRAQVVYPFDGPSMYTPAFESALRRNDLHSVVPGFAAALDANNTGLSGHGVPSLVIQGGRDIIITDPVQERFVRALCNQGSAVRYVNYPTARHRDTRPAGFEASISWMRQLLAPGAVAPSDCLAMN